MKILSIVWILIVILLAIGFYLLLDAMSAINLAQINMYHLMSDLREKAGSIRKTEAARRRYGSTTGDAYNGGFLTAVLTGINNRLIWSGIAIDRPWISAGVYIMATFVCSILVFGILYATVNWVIGLIMGGLVVILPYAIISVKTNTAYHNTEVQLKFFISLISSNSVMAGDLVNVLDMAAPYVTHPIKGAIIRAANTARVKGNPEEAVWQLEREIEHPLFKSFIRNLAICSKNDGDFRSVSKDFALQAEQSLTQLEKQRAIFSNARNEVLLMIGIGVVLSIMSCRFCGRDLIDVLREMQKSLVGTVVLVTEIAIYLATLGYILLGKRR